MKFLSALLCASAVASAADFTTGQAARLVIGQTTFAAQDPTPNAYTLGGVGGVAYANNTLVVVDGNRVDASPVNNRVLVYRNLTLPQPTAEITDQVRCPLCIGNADVVLGQPDFTTTSINLSATGLRVPTAVATDGTRIVVADTDNNRVLIWNRIPDTNAQAADVVLGQTDFTKNQPGRSNQKMRGPQGVWIQGDRLFVADTQNNRILIWNRFPTQNNQAADIVLGQPDFNAGNAPNPITPENSARPNNMYNPVSVSSDGVRLYVSDLGYNRILVWNSIPTGNQQSADLAVGQVDLNSGLANNTKALCAPTGDKDANGNDIYPALCNATVSFPRAAVSDGTRLFIADGGNDRVLVFNTVPTSSGKAADAILGQPAGDIAQVADQFNPDAQLAAVDQLRTPLGLAWDGTNLFVADAFNRRVLVYSPGEPNLPYTAVRNVASREVYGVGEIRFSGKITENNVISVKIGDKEYRYTVKKDDTFDSVIDNLVELLNDNGGDPLLLAIPNKAVAGILLTSRVSGDVGAQTTLTATSYVSDGKTDAGDIIATATPPSANYRNTARIAPGTFVSITGQNLAETTASVPADQNPLPRDFQGVQVYFDGIRAPIVYVSPTQVNAQVPFELAGGTSSSVYIRTKRKDGTVVVTTPIAMPVIDANPGLYAEEGQEPRPGIVYHASSYATGSILFTGTIKANDTATITIEDRAYTTTVVDGDTLESVRDRLVAAINDNGDEKVVASPATNFVRILLRAKVAGPDANGLAFTTSTNTDAQIALSASSAALCCASQAGARVTENNPAVPGEQIIVYATGLGNISPQEAQAGVVTGAQFYGAPENNPAVPVDDAIAGGKTASVLAARMKIGAVALYEVLLELSSDLETNNLTQLTIAQSTQVSNIVTFAVRNPNDQQ